MPFCRFIAAAGWPYSFAAPPARLATTRLAPASLCTALGCIAATAATSYRPADTVFALCAHCGAVTRRLARVVLARTRHYRVWHVACVRGTVVAAHGFGMLLHLQPLAAPLAQVCGTGVSVLVEGTLNVALLWHSAT